MSELLNLLENQTESLVAEIADWCAIESPTEDPAATSRMAEVLAARVEKAGAVVELLPGQQYGTAVKATWAGPAGVAPILLLGHHDTVHPIGSLSRNPVRREQGRLYGPGGYDMKAGLLMAVTALEALAAAGQTLPRPVILLSTADEEVGSQDGRARIEALAREAAAVLVLEPCAGNGALKTARKGVGRFTVTAHGRAAPSGVDHAAGISAIAEMAHQLLKLTAMTDYSSGVTVNVGQVQGGTAENTVPAEAWISVDVRLPAMADVERVLPQIWKLAPVLPGATLTVDGELNRPPMERGPASRRLFALAQELGRGLALDVQETSTGGGSDGNFTAALGIPTLDGLGTHGGGAHTDDEHVLIADLAPRTALLASLLLHI
jgi:glutamate carboxypeptidase